MPTSRSLLSYSAAFFGTMTLAALLAVAPVAAQPTGPGVRPPGPGAGPPSGPPGAGPPGVRPGPGAGPPPGVIMGPDMPPPGPPGRRSAWCDYHALGFTEWRGDRIGYAKLTDEQKAYCEKLKEAS